MNHKQERPSILYFYFRLLYLAITYFENQNRFNILHYSFWCVWFWTEHLISVAKFMKDARQGAKPNSYLSQSKWELNVTGELSIEDQWTKREDINSNTLSLSKLKYTISVLWSCINVHNFSFRIVYVKTWIIPSFWPCWIVNVCHTDAGVLYWLQLPAAKPLSSNMVVNK